MTISEFLIRTIIKESGPARSRINVLPVNPTMTHKIWRIISSMHIFSFRSWRFHRHIIMHKLSFIIFWFSSEGFKDILSVNLSETSYFRGKLTVIGFISCQKCSIERQFVKNVWLKLRIYFRLRISETRIGYQARISGILKWFHFRWLKPFKIPLSR